MRPARPTPCIKSYMMVISIAREKPGAVPKSLHLVQRQRLLKKRRALFDVLHTEVQMPPPRPVQRRCGIQLCARGQQIRYIKRQRRHRHATVVASRPRLRRPVAIKFQPVAVRVGKVYSLAYAVVGKTGEAHSRGGRSPQPRSELRPARQEECGMKQACGVGRRSRSSLGDAKSKQRGRVGGRSEIGAGRRALAKQKSDLSYIEVQRPLQISDPQVHERDCERVCHVGATACGAPPKTHRIAGITVRCPGSTTGAIYIRSLM